MANGIDSLSGRGRTCTVIAAPTFNKNRSRSGENICDGKIKHWIRTGSEEYDEVTNDGQQTTSRFQAGGSSQAAEAAANQAMLTLRRHYGETITITGNDEATPNNTKYLEQSGNMAKLSLSKSALDTSVVPSSPSPPPPPPHRKLMSPSKVKSYKLMILCVYHILLY